MTRAALMEFCRRRANLIYVGLLLLLTMAIGAGLSVFGWTATWAWIKVPTLYPPFADMRIVQAAAASLAAGLDPQISNPSDPWQRPLDYPLIWAQIAQFLHFENERNFLAFTIGWIAVLWGIFCALLYRYPSVWILLAVFSNSTLLLIERGNNDIVVFCLSFLAAVTGFAALGVVLIALATILKIFPFFSAAHLLKNKIACAVLAACGIATMVFYQPQLHKMMAAVSLSQQLSYGTRSLAELLKQRWQINCSPELLLALHLPFIALLLRRKGILDLLPAKGGEDRLFLAGAGIFLASFILSCNWDYRLVFVILCIPYLLRLNHRGLRTSVMLAVILSMNYMLCEQYGQLKWIKLNVAAKSFLFIVIGALFCREILRCDADMQRLWQRLSSIRKRAA